MRLSRQIDSNSGLHDLARLGVQRGKGLVEQQDARIDRKRPRHVDALAL